MKTKLKMPVLAVGGEKSFGNNEAIVMRNAADNVTELVIAGAGHWLMEEAPVETTRVIREFVTSK
jgi:pimeloyl-ACP methyl ester carboxylesterase